MCGATEREFASRLASINALGEVQERVEERGSEGAAKRGGGGKRGGGRGRGREVRPSLSSQIYVRMSMIREEGRLIKTQEPGGWSNGEATSEQRGLGLGLGLRGGDKREEYTRPLSIVRGFAYVRSDVSPHTRCNTKPAHER
jgi:hypothetical protein